MALSIFWTLGLVAVVFLLWRISVILTLSVNNQIEQTSNIILEVERIRVQMFLLRKGHPQPERGWEEFDKEIRLIASSYFIPRRFTVSR